MKFEHRKNEFLIMFKELVLLKSILGTLRSRIAVGSLISVGISDFWLENKRRVLQ